MSPSGPPSTWASPRIPTSSTRPETSDPLPSSQPSPTRASQVILTEALASTQLSLPEFNTSTQLLQSSFQDQTTAGVLTSPTPPPPSTTSSCEAGTEPSRHPMFRTHQIPPFNTLISPWMCTPPARLPQREWEFKPSVTPPRGNSTIPQSTSWSSARVKCLSGLPARCALLFFPLCLHR